MVDVNKKNILNLLKKISKKKTITLKSNLIKDKILDSLDLINLVFMIEDKYKIKFKDQELNDKNFRNISSLLKLISNKIEK